MQITVLNLPHDPERGFDPAPLDEFCRGHDVRGWTEHFYLSAGRPMLALVVEYERVRAVTNGRGARGAGSDDRDPWRDLGTDARPVYQKLREWRSLRSRRDGVPVYVVFSNRQLAAIAEQRPKTKEALRAIDGIGRAKCDRYADDVFTILAEGDPANEADPGSAGGAVVDDAAAAAGEEVASDAS